MKQNFLLKTMLLLCALVAGSSAMWGESYNQTYNYSALGSMISGSKTDASSYWKVPASAGNTATIAIPITYQPTSNITITFSIATFGSGNNPTSSNTTITAAGTETSSNWSGSGVSTYPNSSSYVDGVMTITKPDNPTTLEGLTITMGVNTGVKIFRLQSLTVAYTYDGSQTITYTVTYNANGATGTVPTDATAYSSGATVTVLGNTGSLAKTGYTFAGWNTMANGSGTRYDEDDTFTISANTTLYAQWTANGATLTATNLELTGSYTTNTEKTIDDITYVYSNLMKNNNEIQAKASSGTIKNTTAFSQDIASVVITHSGNANPTTIKGSDDGTTWTQVATGSGSITANFSGLGYKYFQITRGDGAAYWTKIEVTTAPTYSITVSSNNEAYGTVSRSRNLITAEPADGYRVIAGDGGFTVTSGTATVTNNENNTFTVNATSDCTIRINFESIPTHTVTFSVNGTTTSPVSVAEGAAITFPADDPDDIDGKTFVGWTENPITGTQATAPTFVTSATMGNSNVTYYAVFADEGTTQTSENRVLTITPADFTDLTGSYSEVTATKTIGETNYTITIQACKQNDQIQMRDNATISYIHIPELPGKITSVSTTQCNNASGSTYTGTIHLKSSKTRGNSDTDDIVKQALSSVNVFTIEMPSNSDVREFYLVTSAGLRLSNLTVNYQVNSTTTTYSNYCTNVPAFISVTISSAKYATFSNAKAVDFTGTGITAYTATEGTTSVSLSPITSGKVPANTPVVLYKSDADGTAINVPVAASADAVGTNHLHVSTGENPTNAYVLAKPSGKSVGFYLWDSSVRLEEGKIYLKATSSARSFLPFDEATAISDAMRLNDNGQMINDNIYDLQGRRVAQPTKGLYIVNGRKVMIK